MALGTYTGLKTSIADWLSRDDLTAVIPDFIELAEARIYRKLRIPPLESVTEYDTNSVTGDFDLPNDLLEIKAVVVQSSPTRKLEQRSWEEVRDRQDGTTGDPFYFAREGSTLIFYPELTATAVELNVHYWRALAPLTTSNETNWFTENAPSVVLYGALMEAALYLRDEEGVRDWGDKFKDAVDELQFMADTAEYSQGNMRVQHA